MLHINSLFLKSRFIAAGNCLNVGISVMLPENCCVLLLFKGLLSSGNMSWDDLNTLGTSFDTGLQIASFIYENLWKLYWSTSKFGFVSWEVLLEKDRRRSIRPAKQFQGRPNRTWKCEKLSGLKVGKVNVTLTTKLPSIVDRCCLKNKFTIKFLSKFKAHEFTHQSKEFSTDRCTFWATNNPARIQSLKSKKRNK